MAHTIEPGTEAALGVVTCGVVGVGGVGHKGAAARQSVCVKTTQSRAAAAVRIGAQTALRERARGRPGYAADWVAGRGRQRRAGRLGDFPAHIRGRGHVASAV